jgi:signal transduction histidine kinase
MRTLATVLTADAASEQRAHQPVVRLGNVGPAMFVPMVASNRALGTLMVANSRGGRVFSPEDVEIVEAFGQQAAIALEYGRARAELQRLVLMEDRERIAKELHDGVIQSLFAVGMSLQGTALLAGDPDLGRRIEAAVEELDRVIRDLRNYIFGLRPGILADRQLDQALRALAGDFEERTGVVTVADVDQGVAAELGSRAADVVQLTREALSNVGRHAGATTVRLTLRRTPTGALLEIDDDGTGFDVTVLDGTGNGLRNIRERARAMGGDLDLVSSSGEGTTLRVSIQL